MNHTPWTKEQSEKWAMESDVVRKATFEDDAISGFLAGMAKAAEMIEAAPTVYGETTIATQRRVIEKLIEQRNVYHTIATEWGATETPFETLEAQIAAIEKGEA